MSKLDRDLVSSVVSQLHDSDSDYDSDSESGDESTMTESIQVSKDFQEKVVKFVDIDDKIKEKQSELTELRKKLKPLEEYIIKYLDDVDETTVDLNNGKLKKDSKETKSAVNLELIKSVIAEKIEDEDLIDTIMEAMENKRQTKVKVGIKRCKK